MVTSAQIIAAQPIQTQIVEVTAALAALSSANGANGMSSAGIQLTDGNGNPTSALNFAILMSPTEAAAVFGALQTVLTASLASLEAALAAI